MREVIVISSDGLCTPELCIQSEQKQADDSNYIWGVGWYPNEQSSSMIIKDYFSQQSNISIEDFTDWNKFRSTTFFATKKDADIGEENHDIQPFTRSYAGRDWLFISNGLVNKEVLQNKCHSKSLFLEPVGTSGSELLFCYILNKVQKTQARQIYDIKYEEISSWFDNIDDQNQVNFFLSDGSNIICYRGQNAEIDIYYKRISPASSLKEMSSESMYVNFTNPRDQYRTKLIISSCKFDCDGWTPLQPGQVLVVSRGDRVFSNFSDYLSLKINHNVNTRKTVFHERNQDTGNRTIITNTKSMVQTHTGEALHFKQYKITHTTQYRYSEPIAQSVHKFKLQLTEDHLQEIITSSLEISVDGEVIQYEDVFGNNTIHYTINKKYDELVISSNSHVKVFACPTDDHSLSRRQVSIPLVWMPWQRQMMLPYLLPVELPETELDELTIYAMSFVARNNYHLIKTLDDINKTIYKDYEYVPGATSITTSVFEVFTKRRGVCQDFANLFICLSRLLGVPAKYRTGYIYTGGNYENEIQSDASHGWAEVFLPFVGWRGYDPTNGCIANQDHIRVACGRNYIDTTPTAGTIFKGGGKEELTISVKVEEVD